MNVQTPNNADRQILLDALAEFPEILTNVDIQKFTGLSINTINKYASDGKFPNALPKFGRIKRYSKTAFVEFWLKGKATEPQFQKSNKVGRPTIAEKINNNRV